MINDPELRDIFKVESNERLENMDNGLLALEKNPEDAETLKGMFREAHSLKGSSRMLGEDRLEKVAHVFEDLLGMAAKGEIQFTSEIVDELFAGVSGMRKLADEVVENVEKSQVDVEALVNALKALCQTGKASSGIDLDMGAPAQGLKTPLKTDPGPEENLPGKQPEEAPSAPENQAPAEPPPQKKPAKTDKAEPAYRVDTIRVDTQKLDRLINQTGELAVIRTRLRQRLQDAGNLMDLWQDLERALYHFSHLPGLSQAIHDLPAELAQMIQAMQQNLYEDNTELELVARDLEDGVRHLRLLPLSTIFNLFPRMVRDLTRSLDRTVALQITGADTTVDKHILEQIKSPLTHMVRNAVHHGLESPKTRAENKKDPTGVLHLNAFKTATHVIIEVRDDGRGIDLDAVRAKAVANNLLRADEAKEADKNLLLSLIFKSGFTTSKMITNISGRGVGLDVVASEVSQLKGTIEVDTTPGKGCCFTIQLPISLTTSKVFIIRVQDRQFGIPVDFVKQVRQIKKEDVFNDNGRAAINMDQSPVSIVPLASLLEIGAPHPGYGPCLILKSGPDRIGILVDEIEDELEVVVKPHGNLLKQVRNISGSTILGTGNVCTVLDPPDLVSTAYTLGSTGLIARDEEKIEEQERAARHVLLVEDSITTRTQEKRILESAGFEVTTAVDGLDGWTKLSNRFYDAVVSDIEMPNLDGLNLTRRIREHEQFQTLPVILVTSLSKDEDRRKGLEVGANAYISKPSFDQSTLIDTLERLI